MTGPKSSMLSLNFVLNTICLFTFFDEITHSDKIHYMCIIIPSFKNFIPLLQALSLVALTATFTAGFILLLFPIFKRYALARPNTRSSHHIPTPQGGGLAILITIYMFFLINNYVCITEKLPLSFIIMLLSSVGLLILGGVDDIHPLPAMPRFIIQCGLITLTLWQMLDTIRIFPDFIPVYIEWLLIGLALLWMVNLVNFMDGIDLMTVVEMVPIWVVILSNGVLQSDPFIIVLSLCLIGALIGFAPFNWPVAKLFLGDIGSLPLGLMSGWALLLFANDYSLTLALVPPLYYLSDASLTLLKRALRGEKIWHAHRSHYYQLAVQGGTSVKTVIRMVVLCNACLVCITWAALFYRSRFDAYLVDGSALLMAIITVALLIFNLTRKNQPAQPNGTQV